MRQAIMLGLGAVAAATFMGCSGGEPVSSDPGAAPQVDSSTPAPGQADSALETEFSHVLTAPAEYYTTGPQQGRPPDGQLPAGARVHLIEDAGSYCRVRSEDGIEAYVASDVLKPIE